MFGQKCKIKGGCASPSTSMPISSPSVPVVGYLIFRASSSAIANDRTALDDHLCAVNPHVSSVYRHKMATYLGDYSLPDFLLPAS